MAEDKKEDESASLLDSLKSHDSSMTNVRLSGEEENVDELLEALRVNPHVASLTLEKFTPSQFTTKAIPTIVSLVASLHSLTIRHCRITAAASRKIFTTLASSLAQQTLQSLDLSHNPLGPRGAKAVLLLLQSKSCRQLQELNVSNTSLGHFGAQALGGTPSALPKSIQTLDLSQNDLGFDGVWKFADGALPRLTELRQLNVSKNAMQDDGCLEIAHRLEHLPHLERLNLADNGIGAVGMEGLATSLVQQRQGESSLPQDSEAAHTNGDFDASLLHMSTQSLVVSSVTTLDLSSNKLNDAAVEALAKVLHKLPLRRLLLSKNLISDAGAVALSEALVKQQESLPSNSLVELDLSKNTIGDLGAGDFVEHLDSLPHLQTLLFDGNPISDARTRILDMLLKHKRQAQLKSPVKPAISTDAALLGGVEGELERQDTHEEDLQSIDSRDLDADCIEEGRERLGEYLEHLHEHDGEEPAECIELPTDYILHLTNRFHPSQIVSYGAFGKLYSTRDAEDDESVDADNGESHQLPFVVRKVSLGQAGPLQVVRETVLEELQRVRHDALASIVSLTLTAKACLVVYTLPPEAMSLRQLLSDEKHRKSFPWKDRTAVVRKVAQALHALHSGSRTTVSCFHGDVCSSNIYISADFETVKLTDALLSRLIATDRRRFASGDVVFGSRSYRCPRYERGSCQYDAASDMFSYGVVLGEVMTGRLQRSKPPKADARSVMGHDIFYEVLLARNELSIPTDDVLPVLSKPAAEAMIQILVSCLSPNVSHRPSALTAAEILGQLKVLDSVQQSTTK